MMYNTQMFSSNLVQSIGLTIIDTVWQGLLLGVALFVLLSFTPANASTIRYRMSMLALILMFAWAGYSFIDHYQQSVAASELIASSFVANPYMLNPDGILMNENDKNGIVSSLKDYLYPHTAFITSIWLCGVLFLCIRLSGGLIYIRQLKTKSPGVTDLFWLNRMAELSARLGINRMTRLVESAMVSTPMTMGYLRPVIILPVGMLTGIPTAQLESILIHELVHIKKADYLVNIFQSVVEIAFFYHPATWFISQMIQKERENRCDQLTVALIDNPMSYARALTAIEQSGEHAAPRLAMSAHSGKGELTKRIFRILNIENPKPHKDRMVAALLILFLSVSFFSFYTPEKLPPKESITIETADSRQIREKIILPRIHDKDALVEKENAEVTLKELLTGMRDKNKVEKDPEVLLKKAIIPSVSKIDTTFPAVQNPVEIRLKSLHKDTTIIDPPPVYYVNGEKADRNDISFLHPSMIKSMVVWKGEEAIERFGKEGENGIVLIYTKPRLKSFMQEAKAKRDTVKHKTHAFFADEMQVDSSSIRLDGKISVKSSDTTLTGSKLIITTNDYHDPLLVIDGKVSESTLRSWESEVSPDDIESVHVLRGPSAVAIYGKKGAHGVVLIATKKKSIAPQSPSHTMPLREPEIFPNPSSEEFNIRFKLDQRSKVNIRVYDLNGKLIDKVFRKSLNQGTHTIKWKIGDVPSGNYILHLNLGNNTIKKQIMVTQ